MSHSLCNSSSLLILLAKVSKNRAALLATRASEAEYSSPLLHFAELLLALIDHCLVAIAFLQPSIEQLPLVLCYTVQLENALS